MDIKQYLDSTYLKTAKQANLSESDNNEVVRKCIQEAIEENFKLIMIRPDKVSMAREMITQAASKVLIGTVIDFPGGDSSLDEKLSEAEEAIRNGADELDYVVDYNAFKRGEILQIKEEILSCTRLGLLHKKVVKFIIEVAALANDEIIKIASLIKNVIVSNFDEKDYHNVFVKSSTGFYKTVDGMPNGATIPTIALMLENANPLPVKAAGGVRSLEEAIAIINLGVKRIGTSSAKHIADGKKSNNSY